MTIGGEEICRNTAVSHPTTQYFYEMGDLLGSHNNHVRPARCITSAAGESTKHAYSSKSAIGLHEPA